MDSELERVLKLSLDTYKIQEDKKNDLEKAMKLSLEEAILERKEKKDLEQAVKQSLQEFRKIQIISDSIPNVGINSKKVPCPIIFLMEDPSVNYQDLKRYPFLSLGWVSEKSIRGHFAKNWYNNIMPRLQRFPKSFDQTSDAWKTWRNELDKELRSYPGGHPFVSSYTRGI